MDMNPRQRALIAIEKLRIVIAMKNIYQIGMGQMMEEIEEQSYKEMAAQDDSIVVGFSMRIDQAIGDQELMLIESEINLILGIQENRMFLKFLHLIAPEFLIA